MKVKKLIKALKECGDERIPIIATDDGGRKFRLEWNCMDDGPDWAEFAFVVSDRNWPSLDTGLAKAILDYVFSDPNNRSVSLFDDSRFEDYRFKVVWPCDRDYNGCGWSSSGVEKISIRDTKDGRRMFLKVGELPPWKDEDYDQEAMDKAKAEAKKKAAECMAYMEGKAEIVPQKEGAEE